MIGHREQGDSALAFPTLLSLLNDPDDRVRFEAADNLVRIPEQEGHEAVLAVIPDAGAIVLAALSDDRDDYERAMLAGTLGELRHEPAIPVLIVLLQDADDLVRREAAWSLGRLHAADAEFALSQALEAETTKRAAEAIREALTAINSTRDAEL